MSGVGEDNEIQVMRNLSVSGWCPAGVRHLKEPDTSRTPA